MIDLGMVQPGETIYIPFDSFAGSTGASVTLTGLLASDIEVYKDGSVTQRASDNGYTLLDTDGIDFDGITGIHGFSINLADNSTAGFWAAGSRYFVVVSSVTIDSQTVNFVAATFTIGYTGAILNTTIATLSSQTSFTLTSGPAEDDALNGALVLIHDVASAVQKGFAFISDYTGSTKTVTLAAGTTFTAAATDNISVFPRVDVGHFAGVAATSSGGRPEVNTTHAAGTAWGAGAITAASIATGAIDADAIADNAIDAGAIASGAITSAKIGSGTFTFDALTISGATTFTGAITGSNASNNLRINGVAPGASGGLFIAGSNASTTISALAVTNDITAATVNVVGLTVSGATSLGSVAVTAGIAITQSTGNGHGVTITGNGTGSGLRVVGGATGRGFYAVGGSTSGDAIRTEVTASQGEHLKHINAGIDGTQDETIVEAIWSHATRTLTGATNITSTGGSVPITAGGLVSADVTAISTDTAAADNCELFFDGTGYNASNSTVGTVTTLTNKTGFSLAATGMDSVTLPANLITATSIASNAITAAKIATDAIDADALAADAVAEIWTTALTETYGTDGSALTGAQLAYLILAHVGEFAISSTTKTLKKLDGSTTAATYTLDSATTPTSITRAT